MIKVVGITFKEKGKMYYFDPQDFKIKKNLTVIVETEQGLQFAKSITEVIELEDSKIKTPLKKVVRISTKNDYQKHLKNLKESKEALEKCKELVKKLNLEMSVIDATFTFDREQLVFQFISDNRVDFRTLAKQLAALYKTRIELRQVGVRDKAKEVGGLGPCGRKLCCGAFLNDFDTVSINMAKNQGIALNPSKINGSCGRLKCCLKYENETYTLCKKILPKVGMQIETEEGIGIVKSIDIFKGTYKVLIDKKGLIEFKKEKPNCDECKESLTRV